MIKDVLVYYECDWCGKLEEVELSKKERRQGFFPKAPKMWVVDGNYGKIFCLHKHLISLKKAREASYGAAEAYVDREKTKAKKARKKEEKKKAKC